MNYYGIIWNSHFKWQAGTKAEGYNARTQVAQPCYDASRELSGIQANPNQEAKQGKNCQVEKLASSFYPLSPGCMSARLGGYCIHPIFSPSRCTLSSSDKICKFCVQILEESTNIMCAWKNHPSDNRRPTNLPEFQVSVSKSLQATAELGYPKCSARRSVAHCSRDVANGSMRMEASSYTSTSSVTRPSSCLAFPCRALPDQKYLLSSCIANSFLHVRSRITKMRG